MTVLEACLEVLREKQHPMNAREILTEIESRNLYEFKAKDPAKVISSAIRNNLKNAKPPSLKEVGKGKYDTI